MAKGYELSVSISMSIKESVTYNSKFHESTAKVFFTITKERKLLICPSCHG